MSFKIDDTNYLEYKKVFEIFWMHQLKFYPTEIVKNASPIDALNEFEKKSKSIAKRGLKEGLRDMISQLNHFPSDLLKDIETDLAKNNLPTTKILFGVFTNTATKVLKRKKIKSQDEFYTIKELVVDLTSNLTEEERNILDKYLVEFEFGSKKTNFT
jgi:hypothetical protein